MKKLLSIGVIGLFALTALVFVRCSELTGSAPTNVKIEAATDSTVTISWSAPTDGTPDKYEVEFMEVNTSSWTMIANNATTTEYTHAPAGKTGEYRVTAMFGSTGYAATTFPTSTPVHNSAQTVSELNAAGNSGYGWDRTAGTGSTYSMSTASNAALVDFYITDFANGYSGATYSIASPDEGPSDPGAVVPSGSWRINSFSNALTNLNDPLPAHSANSYFNYTDLASDPTSVGCYTADGYYALVKLSGFNTGAGTVQAESWFQLVKGLRLIEH